MEEYQVRWAIVVIVIAAAGTAVEVAHHIATTNTTKAAMEHGYEQVLDSKGNVMWRPVGTYKSEL